MSKNNSQALMIVMLVDTSGYEYLGDDLTLLNGNLAQHNIFFKLVRLD